MKCPGRILAYSTKHAAAFVVLAAFAASVIGATARAQMPPPTPSVLKPQAEIGATVVLPDLVYARVPGFRPLKLDLYRPKNATKPLPAVVWVHGGAWMMGDQRDGIFLGQDWTQSLADLAAHGYVVAGVSYRLDGEARFPAQIQDIRAAIRWLRAHASEYGIDATQVMAIGGSAGGYLAALAGVSCGDSSLDPAPVPMMPGMPAPPSAPPVPGSECLQAVVAVYPVVDLPPLSRVPGPNGQPSDTEDSLNGRFLGCAMAKCAPTTLQAASILERIDAKDPPFLILHGDADKMVPIDQSRALDSALKAKGVPSELVVVPGANHVFPGLPAQTRTELLNRIWRFFDDHSKH